MLEKLRRALVILLGRERAITGLRPRATDVFLVSYPKSGNTWLRFLVGNLVDPEQPMSFGNLEDRVPDLYQNYASSLERMANPRYLKSHEPFTPAYRLVIYLVRDPRDIALSYYHHQVKFGGFDRNYPIQAFCHDFVKGAIDAYGPWGEHVGSWLGARRGTTGFLLTRYEDLHSDLIHELRRIARLLDLELGQSQLEIAAGASSFSRMRELEASQGQAWKPLQTTDPSQPFMRSGRIGEWAEALPTECADLIWEAWSEQMIAVAYHAHPQA